MKKSLFSILILACNFVFAQTVAPETYSKIKFVYKQKSNFLFENDILYADTLLLRNTFPKLKFEKFISPNDSTRTIGFVYVKNLKKEDKRILESTIYHTTHTITGTYDLKTNITKLEFKRGSPTIKEIFKKYFSGSHPFAFNVIIDYNKCIINTNYPTVNYSATFDSELKKIIYFNEDKSIGTYSFQTHNGYHTNVVDINKNHSKNITPNVVFSNNDYAIEKITSLNNTTTLLSVIYEK